MKIISSYKDYYDYLQGVYGIDAKIIYDRTDFYKPHLESKARTFQKEVFYVCGYRVEGLWLDGKILYGDEIAPLHVYHFFNKPGYYSVQNTQTQISVLREPIIDTNKNNDKYDCPVLYEGNSPTDLKRNPILSIFEFHKAYAAHELWLMLSEWLAREKEIINNQSSIEKIEAHGFDKKYSFRHRK